MLGQLRQKIVIGALVLACTALTLDSCSHQGANGGGAAASEPPATSNTSFVQGPISAPGGPFLYDRYGRVVILHGVNAVFKKPPFELVPAPGKPWNFTNADAAKIASFGFDIVRLGIIWQGLEPGYGSINDPATCTKGTPGNAHEYNQSIINKYLSRLDKTVSILAAHGIFTLIDMHQDVWNQAFEGEGAPNWAVCTNSIAIKNIPGRWSGNYAQSALEAAYNNFFTNDVVGNLQGNYDRVWASVASYFKNNAWVIGYDPFNEPTGGATTSLHNAPFDALLQCFYAGRANPGSVNIAGAQQGGLASGAVGGAKLTCPADDPRLGVIPTIEKADPNHLVFPETDIASDGVPTYIGPMAFGRLVLNFHNYCLFRQNNGNDIPGQAGTCAALDGLTFTRRFAERAADASPAQPGGPAWFLSEFGATNSKSELNTMTNDADLNLVGWAYWQFKTYEDPTGSSNEALVTNKDKPYKKIYYLDRPYAQAIAGMPIAMSYNVTSDTFQLRYKPDYHLRVPTVVFVPVSLHYKHGYCATASGATIVSKPNASKLLVENVSPAPHASAPHASAPHASAPHASGRSSKMIPASSSTSGTSLAWIEIRPGACH